MDNANELKLYKKILVDIRDYMNENQQRLNSFSQETGHPVGYYPCY